ncbi:MAG: SDR family oxidoreductase [Candidatus Hydrogenedens sp.]|nr:SDR family oxidoreductase [Candidatus Hydrogenedentota bacterium]NLF58579.1 SDR family oxidoreductase [Candidatus Hydrogenedens sp.]
MFLAGKTAVITGAGRGIGRAIALAFAREGCDVALAARTEAELEGTARMVMSLRRRALAVPCDVADPQSVAAMAETVLAEFGQVDLLVNNAGFGRFKPFHELTLEDWRQTIEVNLTGTFLCTRAFLPGMMARKSGRIINISSVSGLKGLPEQSAYCAAKHAVNGLTKTLALELRGHGIAVHAICPGGVDTRMARENMPHRDKTDWMTPEDIAHTALYLAGQSPRAATDIIHVRRFDSEPL